MHCFDDIFTKPTLFLLLCHSFMQYGNTPLGIAAANGHANAVLKLLDLGADINQQTMVNQYTV